MIARRVTLVNNLAKINFLLAQTNLLRRKSPSLLLLADVLVIWQKMIFDEVWRFYCTKVLGGEIPCIHNVIDGKVCIFGVVSFMDKAVYTTLVDTTQHSVVIYESEAWELCNVLTTNLWQQTQWADSRTFHLSVCAQISCVLNRSWKNI